MKNRIFKAMKEIEDDRNKELVSQALGYDSDCKSKVLIDCRNIKLYKNNTTTYFYQLLKSYNDLDKDLERNREKISSYNEDIVTLFDTAFYQNDKPKTFNNSSEYIIYFDDLYSKRAETITSIVATDKKLKCIQSLIESELRSICISSSDELIFFNKHTQLFFYVDLKDINFLGEIIDFQKDPLLLGPCNNPKCFECHKISGK